MIGRTLGHYRIESKLGEGGMGVVYQALDTNLGRQVAIKMLPEAFARDAERLARFEREARLLASLNHPNIAMIHGLEQSEGRPFLVLELVPGPTLAERLASGAMEIEEALGASRQLAEALEAAHEKGILHRDLKPANIKLTPEGKVKVLDFGLAKAFDADPGAAGDPSHSPTLTAAATRAGTILGTAAYMSPEQARGRTLDKRSDVWAFGCVLYELLSGRRAFGGESISDTLAAVLKTEPDWNALPAATPACIRTLLRRSLEKDPARRLRDIGDGRMEIEEALAAPHSAAAVTPGAAPRVRSNRVALVAGIAALLVGLLTGYLLWRQPRASARPGVVARFMLPLQCNTTLARFFGNALALSPDGETLIFAGFTGATGVRQLYIQRLEGGECRPLAGTEHARAPFFSPDGKWVGFFDLGKLKKIPLSGGLPVTLADIGQPDSMGSWGTNDTIIFTGGGMFAGLQAVSASGGTPRQLTKIEPGENLHRNPDVLPGGKAVLFTVWMGSADNSQIAVLPLEAGKRRILLQGTNARYASSGHLLFMHGGNIHAVPFDLQRLELTGPPVPMVEGVLTAAYAGQWTFSQSGTLMYLSGRDESGENKPFWVNRQGGAGAVGVPSRNYANPFVSGDGRRILFTIRDANPDIWAYDVDRGGLTRLSFDQGEDETPVLSPDGRRVAYCSTRMGQPRTIHQRFTDGSGSEERLWTSQYHTHLSGWSADGKWLAFEESHPNSKWDIWLLPLEGDRKARLFLQTPFNELRARFSPDGRWVAYMSDESNRNEVYVRPLAEGGGRWQVSTEGGASPAWSADGKELFFRNGNQMMVAEVRAGTAFGWGTPRKLFEEQFLDYDVAPDGRRFLMIRANTSERAAAPQLSVVLNWFEELRRRAPAGSN